MSKPKVWTLPELLDRIWMLSRGKRTAVATGETRKVFKGASGGVVPCDKNFEPLESAIFEAVTKRVVTGWDEDYKPRTYELNKISAASAAGLYERIKTMRTAGPDDNKAEWGRGWQAGYDARELVGFKMPDELALELSRRLLESSPPDLMPQVAACSCGNWGAVYDLHCPVHGGRI